VSGHFLRLHAPLATGTRLAIQRNISLSYFPLTMCCWCSILCILCRTTNFWLHSLLFSRKDPSMLKLPLLTLKPSRLVRTRMGMKPRVLWREATPFCRLPSLSLRLKVQRRNRNAWRTWLPRVHWWFVRAAHWEPQEEGMMSTAASLPSVVKPRLNQTSRRKPNFRRSCLLASWHSVQGCQITACLRVAFHQQQRETCTQHN
jgi:hypothetical protein